MIGPDPPRFARAPHVSVLFRFVTIRRPGSTPERPMSLDEIFADLSSRVAKGAGRPVTFIAAAVVILAWGLSGPLFGLSDTWQLIMNTISSIVTFLMVFLIQNAQARDSEAIHAKLDELIRAVANADNRLIAIEQLPDDQIEQFRAKHGPRPTADKPSR
jgi:low affinity Fe/Cu permease